MCATKKMDELTTRQKNEIEYHKQRAAQYVSLLEKPVYYGVLENPEKLWFNPYWRMFRDILKGGVVGKKTLVVGCGFGEDAFRLAKAGAVVHAFDISAESLAIARRLALRERLAIKFSECPAERMVYADDTFELVFVRDTLHHVDVPKAMAEMRRVAKRGARFFLDEIYSHSITNFVRRSKLVERVLYPNLQRFVYDGTVYITPDERKLSENDLAEIKKHAQIDTTRYYNAVVTRLISDRHDMLCKLDRLSLLAAGPFAKYLAGRVVMLGSFSE